MEARPIFRRLRSYPKVRGQCVGAFADRGMQLGHPSAARREAAMSAAMRYWRRSGAVSVEAAVATDSARYGTAAIGDMGS